MKLMSVHFGTESLQVMNAELAKIGKNKVFFMVDENTHEHCLPQLLAALPDLNGYEILEIEPGEESKDFEIAKSLWSALAELGADRKSLLINVGGGVVTDLGGFVASTYKRGIAFWHVPTSLLGMVDAAIGGKTGVDVDGVKNLVGTFSSPQQLFIIPEFLETLPEEHLTSGMAEVLKHGLISDRKYWEEAQKAFKTGSFESLVNRSVALKSAIVLADEKEQGQRKLLNFGHSLGHAVESYFLEKGEAILHGEAVAAGMMMEAKLSTEKAGLPEDSFLEITKVLSAVYPKLEWPIEDETAILSWLAHDKKNESGELRFTLLREIGKGIFDVPVTLDEAAIALNWYKESL